MGRFQEQPLLGGPARPPQFSDEWHPLAWLVEVDGLIEDLTVDAYGDEEQLSGLLVGAQEALRRGEPATIVGVGVEVALADLAFPSGSELGLVIAAYRRWQGR